ncbi:fatty acid oxidation complex subunit alpha FadB, partial [bacterium AH-315-K03]|nr:fatty acid oxidation complex subunit alpha FadB [bacterium AH-315-K03]
HAGEIMAQGFPDRMQHTFKTAMEVLLDNERLGEKNARGFYSYEPDKRGKVKKTYDPSVRVLLAPHTAAATEFDAQTIIDRLMIPLCLESVRCLEQGIASSANDIDMALIFGVGFPPFKGGALRYLENMGIQTLLIITAFID